MPMNKQEIYREVDQLQPIFDDSVASLFAHPETG